MSNLEPYYDNHSNALKFPWSLYHKPIYTRLISELANYQQKSVLSIGPGSLEEVDSLQKFHCELDILDIDPRVIENLKEKFGGLIKNSYLVHKDFENYPQKTYEFIYAKEVIEHLINYDDFLLKLKSLMGANSTLWLSTPNYGYFLLPLVEKTALELISRFKGFSRKSIHPTKFNSKTLEEALIRAGFSNINVSECSYKMVLIARATLE